MFEMALRKNRANVGAPANFSSLLAYSSFVFFIIGVALWIAGHSYLAGYWLEAQLPNTLEQVTLQETMYSGFLSFGNWIGVFLFGAGLCLLMFIFSIRKVKKANRANQTNFLSKFVQKHYYIELNDARRSGSIAIATVAYMLLALFAAFWVVGADEQGRKLFRKQTCQIQAGAPLPTTLVLDKGGNVTGRTILRSENTTVLMNVQGLYVVDLRKANRISERVNFPDIDCAVEFPKVVSKNRVEKL